MNHEHPHDHAHHPPSGPAQAKDPVCGMRVAPETAKAKLEHGGQMYFFCCQRCLEKFRADPSVYLAPAPKVAPPARPAPPDKPVSEQGTYTCPMHPEVVQSEPGSCPICGMALEPRSG
jgi:YHS domain-containing protein